MGGVYYNPADSARGIMFLNYEFCNFYKASTWERTPRANNWKRGRIPRAGGLRQPRGKGGPVCRRPVAGTIEIRAVDDAASDDLHVLRPEHVYRPVDDGALLDDDGLAALHVQDADMVFARTEPPDRSRRLRFGERRIGKDMERRRIASEGDRELPRTVHLHDEVPSLAARLRTIRERQDLHGSRVLERVRRDTQLARRVHVEGHEGGQGRLLDGTLIAGPHLVDRERRDARRADRQRPSVPRDLERARGADAQKRGR